MKKCFLIFLYAVIVLCMISCNQAVDDTESDETSCAEETLPPEIIALEPLPEPKYGGKTERLISGIVKKRTRLENVIYVDSDLHSEWEKEPEEEKSIGILAIEWFDVFPNYDREYGDIFLQYGMDRGAALAAEKEYNSNPNEKNKEIYDSLRQHVQLWVDRLDEYGDSVEKKISELTTHFETMGIEVESIDSELYLTANKEQLLTLVDTRFALFVVWEEGERVEDIE